MAHLLGAAVPAGLHSFALFYLLISRKAAPLWCLQEVSPQEQDPLDPKQDSLDFFSTVREELGKPCCFGFGESSELTVATSVSSLHPVSIHKKLKWKN